MLIKDEFALDIVSTWTAEQLDDYIQKLEARITVTHAFVKELKRLKKNKSRKVTDTGGRGAK